MTAATAALARYAACFEQLSPDGLDALTELFAVDARFKDPFNDVRGRAAIRAVFAHMYATLQAPRFEVTAQALHGGVGLLHWRLSFRAAAGAAPRRIEGMSRVCFDAAGRVTEHVDYWDPVEQLYADVPVLGWLLERVRRRLAAGPG